MVYEDLLISNLVGGASIGELVAIFLASVILIIIAIAIYVFWAIALMTIANKTKTKNAWLAWIPIANIYLTVRIAKLNGWWTLAFLLPVIPYVGFLAYLVLTIWWWWRISERKRRPGWWGILMAIPIVNMVIIGLLAWQK